MKDNHLTIMSSDHPKLKQFNNIKYISFTDDDRFVKMYMHELPDTPITTVEVYEYFSETKHCNKCVKKHLTRGNTQKTCIATTHQVGEIARYTRNIMFSDQECQDYVGIYRSHLTINNITYKYSHSLYPPRGLKLITSIYTLGNR